MKRLRGLTGTLLAASLLSGCALFVPRSITPGEPESSVIARLGKPTARYADARETLLEYRTNPGGQETWMVRLDENGRAKSIEQVLTSPRFASILVGKDTREDVLRKVGAPYETMYLPLSDLTVWSYMYREIGVWDSLMHVHFDRNGVVKMLTNAPDLSRRPIGGALGG